MSGYWETAEQLRIREPDLGLDDYCGVLPDSSGTLPAFQPWCGDGFRSRREAPVRAPRPCVPAPGVYCNDGVSTIDAPCGPTTIQVAAWDLDRSPPGVPGYSSFGGKFTSPSGRTLARAGVSAAGLIHFARPAIPVVGGVAAQNYHPQGFGGTSGATPTLSAVVAALTDRLPELWRTVWAPDSGAVMLTHPGLAHALVLALCDGTGVAPERIQDGEAWVGLDPQTGAGRIRGEVLRWVLGERFGVGPRRAMTLGVLRHAQPGTSWRLPEPGWPVGTSRLLSTTAALFFVDPRYAATGEVATPARLELHPRPGPSRGPFAADGGEVAGLADATSVENRRRVLVRWPKGLQASGGRPLWRARFPKVDAKGTPGAFMHVWYAIIEEYA